MAPGDLQEVLEALKPMGRAQPDLLVGLGAADDAAVYRITADVAIVATVRSEEHTSELQSRLHLVCRLLLEKKKIERYRRHHVQAPASPLALYSAREGSDGLCYSEIATLVTGAEYMQHALLPPLATIHSLAV